MKWVPIAGRLPQTGAKVLLWDGREIKTGFRNPHFFGGFSTGAEHGACITGATHWAAFPTTPPAKGGEND